MLFNSLTFLIFAALFFPLYFATRGRARYAVALVGSYLFYGWWDWRFLGLLILATLVDYGVGRWLGVTEDRSARRRILAISLSANLGLLGFFKYFNFFADSFTRVLETFGMRPDPVTLNVILPVGISFYTFQTMSYTIDVYRRLIQPETSLLRFATFVALFPQLVAGPIVRAKDLLPQMMTDARFSWRRIGEGIELIALGYFMKVVVADNLAPLVDLRFATPDAFGSRDLAAGVLAFAFQIYGDFAGYSLIAIGLGHVMGYWFPRNFHRPYFARSFSDFWERWHISLSSWLRDYLYIPLGGNRHGSFQTFRNLFTTMLLGGLWHGANWTFVLWGALHGTYLIVQRVVAPVFGRVERALHLPPPVGVALGMAIVFAAVVAAWIPFRARSLAESAAIVGGILSFGGPAPDGETTGLGWIPILVALELAMATGSLRRLYLGSRWLRFAAVQILFWTVFLYGSMSGQEFIYFDF